MTYLYTRYRKILPSSSSNTELLNTYSVGRYFFFLSNIQLKTKKPLPNFAKTCQARIQIRSLHTSMKKMFSGKLM